MLHSNSPRSASSKCHCLICLDLILTPKRKSKWTPSTNSPTPQTKTNQMLIQRLMTVLNISSDLESLNLDQDVPFCKSCVKGIHQLIRVQDKLEVVLKELHFEIQGLEEKIKGTKVRCDDVKIINFRNQILRGTQNRNQYHLNNSQPTNYVLNPLNSLQNSATLQYNTTSEVQFEIEIPSVSNITTNHHYAQQVNVIPSSGIVPGNFGNSVDLDLDDGQGSPEGRKDLDDDDYIESVSENDDEDDVGIQNSKRRQRDKNNTTPRTAENFSEIRTTSDGRLFYETFEILKQSQGYVCGFCGYDKVKGINNVTLRKMKIHIKGVHQGAYKCPTCQKNYNSSDILTQHIKRIHTEAPKNCSICSRPCKNTGLQEHLWTHKSSEEKAEAHRLGQVPAIVLNVKRKQKRHQCPTCGKRFRVAGRLQTHAKTHLVPAKDRKAIKCPETDCLQLFVNKQGLREHTLRVHEKDKIVRWFTCAPCAKLGKSRTFHQKYEFLQHQIRRHKPSEEKHLVCSICNARFGLEIDLKAHLRRHRPAEMFTQECPISSCRFKLISKGALKKHRRNKHPNSDPLLWEHLFPRKKALVQGPKVLVDLKEYMKKYTKKSERFGPFVKVNGQLMFEGYEVSKLDNGFACVACGAEFQQKNPESAIKGHIKGVHLGHYPCQFCNLQCTSTDHLSSHRISHLEKDCPICSKPLDGWKNIRSHLWTHKNRSEMISCVNSGECIPYGFKILKNTLARLVSPEEPDCENCDKDPILCTEKIEACSKSSFATVCELDDHVLDKHPTKVKKKFRPNSLERKLLMESGESRDESDQNIQNRRKPGRPRKTRKSEQISADSDSDGSDNELTDASSSSESDSPTSYKSTKKRGATTKIDPDSDSKLNPSLILLKLPACLSTSRNVKLISDSLLSYVSSNGKLKLLTLQSLHEMDKDVETDDEEVTEDVEVKVEPEPDSMQ